MIRSLVEGVFKRVLGEYVELDRRSLNISVSHCQPSYLLHSVTKFLSLPSGLQRRNRLERCQAARRRLRQVAAADPFDPRPDPEALPQGALECLELIASAAGSAWPSSGNRASGQIEMERATREAAQLGAVAEAGPRPRRLKVA